MTETKQNPKEIDAIVRHGFTLSISDDLTAETSVDAPFKLTNLSRFSIFASDKRSSETTRYFRANIPQSDVKGIYNKMQAVLAAKAQWDINSVFCNGAAEEKENKNAWSELTAQFKFGKQSGKSIVQVACEMSSKDLKDFLEYQRGILAKNIEKFPANKTIVAQIDKALQLQKEGVEPPKTKRAGGTKAAPVLSVYHQDTKPLFSTEKDGLSIVYDIDISCIFGNDFPWKLTIGNKWSTVTKDAYGKPVVGNGGKPREQTTIICSDEEMLAIVNRMVELTNAFVSSTYSASKEKMQKIVQERINQKNKNFG